jgi:hypothetical protein
VIYLRGLTGAHRSIALVPVLPPAAASISCPANARSPRDSSLARAPEVTTIARPVPTACYSVPRRTRLRDRPRAKVAACDTRSSAMSVCICGERRER